MKSMLITFCFGLCSMAMASDQSQQTDNNECAPKRVDYAQQHMRQFAMQAVVINRLCDILEATEHVAVYTEDPPKLTIQLSETETITATGSIACKTYGMFQHKKNLPSPAEAYTIMQQFLKVDFPENKNQ